MDGTIRLTCEFLHNPLGVQTAHPRFSWYSDEPKGMQAGWRIRVAASEEDLRGGPLLWDSGPVASGRCTAIPYEGVPLESRRRYWWRLTLSLAGEDEPLESAPAWFETGILSPGEWQADWMAAPAHTYGVTDWFRRPFRLTAPPVSARLYISGIGYCEAFLNGEKIGDRLLDPGWTDYRRRVLYSVYDITPYLCEGENVLGVELAEGWYGHRHESFDRFMGGQPAFQGTPRLLLEADIRLADGGRVRLLSGPAGGFSTHPGAVVENGVYDGEVYDARREQPGWACPGPVGAAWKPVEAAEPPGGVLTAQLMPPIRRLDTLTPRCLLRVADGRLDLSLLAQLPYPEAKRLLMEIKGVGVKVADCILLFGAGQMEAFPIDTWMKKAISHFYGSAPFDPARFGTHQGIAQQYLFYYARAHKIAE